MQRKKYHTTQHHIRAMTIIELALVIVVVTVLFLASSRVIDSVLGRQFYKSTVKEMYEIRKALIGDQNYISGGQRLDFGYVGSLGHLPNDLVGWRGCFLSPSTEHWADAWGTDYAVTYGDPFQVTSLGADRAAGGTGFNEDIVLSIPRGPYENNTVVIACKDGHGNILRGNDGELGFHIRRIDLLRINPVGGATVAVADYQGGSGGITYSNGVFTAAGTPMGRYIVQVYPADGTGGTSGTVDWRQDLNNNLAVISETGCIVPKGPNRFNFFEIRFPGSIRPMG